MSEIFNADIFIVSPEDFKDDTKFEKVKLELNTLLHGNSQKKVLVLLDEIDQAFCK